MHFLSELDTKANQEISEKKIAGIFSRPDMYSKRKVTYLLYKNKSVNVYCLSQITENSFNLGNYVQWVPSIQLAPAKVKVHL
jgi:hypothetical protein